MSSTNNSASSNESKSQSYIYTESGRGQSQKTGQWTDPSPSMECVVEFFDDYISVNGMYCKYVKTIGGWKVYEGSTMWGMTPYYYVDGNKNMKKVCDYLSAYGSDTFVYPMSRNGDPTPTGGNGGSYNNTNSSFNNYDNHRMDNDSHNNTQPARQFKCAYCNGTGRIERNDNAPANFGIDKPQRKCNECGKWYNPNTFVHYHQVCGHCGGTGKLK